MKVSDYIVHFLESQGVRIVFGYQGSSIAHTIDSISKSNQLRYIQLYHEQAVAFAANGYAELGQGIGVAVACSGPGAMNLLSGVANAYFDSNKCMFITGQVSTHEMRNGRKIRQAGFQETDIVAMVKDITKYAVTILRAEDIAFEMEKACYLMTEGRGGPVLLDIPHNIQNAVIEEENMKHFDRPYVQKKGIDEAKLAESAEILKNGKRPLILLGGGAKEIRKDSGIQNCLKNIGVPIISSYRGKDVYDNLANNYFGVVGAYGNRFANYLVRYCDVLIIVGSRIDGRQTGNDIENFAKQARIVYVDIDNEELKEKQDRFLTIYGEASQYLEKLLELLKGYTGVKKWLKTAHLWKTRLSDEQEYRLKGGTNPNYFLKKLTRAVNGRGIVSADVGQNQIWTNTSAFLSNGYLLQSCGLGAMGYALPAAIGAFFGNDKMPLFCVCGDGGFQMNIQELQTISVHQIPVKIFVLNNASLGLIRVYQEKALSSNLVGSVEGFQAPNCEKLATAYDMIYYRIENNCFDDLLLQIISEQKPCLVEVCISELSTCYPEPTYKSEFYNQSPELSEKEKMEIQEEAYATEEN